MTPDETVTEFLRRVTSGDLDGACELVTDDVEYDNVPMGKNHGPDEMKAFLGPMVLELDEVEWIVHRQAASGAVVMNERTDVFRAQGAEMAIPVCGVFELTGDGRISLWRDYFDMAVVNEGIAALTAATASD
jgi:limonene-1,2-epoxide hydrolase